MPIISPGFSAPPAVPRLKILRICAIGGGPVDSVIQWAMDTAARRLRALGHTVGEQDDLPLADTGSGASWEGFALEQVLRIAKPQPAYFWATHQGAGLDLLMLHGSERIGVEFKRTDTPSFTRSMRIALQDLRLDRL